MIRLNNSKTFAPIAYSPFLSRSDLMDILVFVQEHGSDAVKKDGMERINLAYFWENNSIVRQIIESKFEEPLNVIAGNIFKTSNPYVPHTDVPKHAVGLTKNILIPIVIPLEQQVNETEMELLNLNFENPQVVLFNQFYHGPGSHFLHGIDYQLDPVHNRVITSDYRTEGVLGLTNTTFSDSDYSLVDMLYTPKSCYDGLSIYTLFDWMPGSCIIFESARIHCSSNFKKNGVAWKLGITLVVEEDVGY